MSAAKGRYEVFILSSARNLTVVAAARQRDLRVVLTPGQYWRSFAPTPAVSHGLLTQFGPIRAWFRRRGPPAGRKKGAVACGKGGRPRFDGAEPCRQVCVKLAELPYRCQYMQSLLKSLAAALPLLSLGCGASRPAEPSAAGAASATTKSAEVAPVAMLDATILFTDCSAVSDMNAKLAERTMRRLVEACDTVPNGKAQFVATLMVGGRIEITAAEGADQTLPICVLKHQLQHQVKVKQACKMQIQMEQKSSGAAGATK